VPPIDAQRPILDPISGDPKLEQVGGAIFGYPLFRPRRRHRRHLGEAIVDLRTVLVRSLTQPLLNRIPTALFDVVKETALISFIYDTGH
jgi:hypothetical protein